MNFVTSVFKKYINKNENTQEKQDEQTKDIVAQSSTTPSTSPLLREADYITKESPRECQNGADEEELFEDAEINPTINRQFSTTMADNEVRCFLPTIDLPPAKTSKEATKTNAESLHENSTNNNFAPAASVNPIDETLDQKEFTEQDSLTNSLELKILPLTHEYSDSTSVNLEPEVLIVQDPVSSEGDENCEHCKSPTTDLSLESNEKMSNETKLVSLSDILFDSPASRNRVNLDTVDLQSEKNPIPKEQGNESKGALETLIQNVNEALAINNSVMHENVEEGKPNIEEVEQVDAIIIVPKDEEATENQTTKSAEIDEGDEKMKFEEERVAGDTEVEPEMEKNGYESTTVENLDNIEKNEDSEDNREECEECANKLSEEFHEKLADNKSSIEEENDTTAQIELNEKRKNIFERQDTQEFELLERDIRESNDTSNSLPVAEVDVQNCVTLPSNKSEISHTQYLYSTSLENHPQEPTAMETNGKDVDEECRLTYERQETKEFEELEKATLRSSASNEQMEQNTKFDMEVILDQLVSESSNSTNITDQTENRHSRDFDQIEKQCIGDELNKEMDKNEIGEDQRNRTFARQDTQEFENLEKQCSKEDAEKETINPDDVLEALVDVQTTKEKPVEEIIETVEQGENNLVEPTADDIVEEDAREVKSKTAFNVFLEGLLTPSGQKGTKSKNEKTQTNKNIKQLEQEKSPELKDTQSKEIVVDSSDLKNVVVEPHDGETVTNADIRTALTQSTHSESQKKEKRNNGIETKPISSIKYKILLKEYEKRVAQQTKDLENLRMESARGARKFTNTEMAFSDLFEKYEKTKSIIAMYGRNEDILLDNIRNMEEQLSQVESKCLAMKEQSVEQIRRACEQVEQEKRQFKLEVTKLEAQVKRLQIKASSLELQLKQKNEECQALAALCDDITGRN